MLKNNALELTAGTPVEWKGAAGLEADTANLPDGVTTSIKIAIKAGDKSSHGQLSQRAAVAKADAHYRIGAWLKASAARCAYVQVKLYGADRKELKRLTAGYATTEWAHVDAVVDASGAAAIELLLRWIPDPKFDGATAWFASASLSPTDAPATLSENAKPQEDAPKQAAAGAAPAYTIVLVGDSTVQPYPEQSAQRGWGEKLGEFLAPGVQVLNHAVGGRSTKTFRSEGRWEKVLAAKPQMILLQFGHNDSHEAGRPESTDAATDYPANLRQYVAEAKAAGIAIVLVTPPPRRVFNGDGISTALRPYAAAMQAVATETGVPCIDLFAGGSEILRQRGEDGSTMLFCSDKDRSHFSADGARTMARLVAEGLLALGDSTKTLLRTGAQWPPALAQAK